MKKNDRAALKDEVLRALDLQPLAWSQDKQLRGH